MTFAETKPQHTTAVGQPSLAVAAAETQLKPKYSILSGVNFSETPICLPRIEAATQSNYIDNPQDEPPLCFGEHFVMLSVLSVPGI